MKKAKFTALCLLLASALLLSSCSLALDEQEYTRDQLVGISVKLGSSQSVHNSNKLTGSRYEPHEVDGKMIRLVFPPLTEERRKMLAKDIAKMAEESKVAIRSIRRDAIDKLKAMKKAGDLTEDDVKDGEKKIQDITDKRCKEADAMADAKQKDIMEI